jgi:uncharacterized protein YjaG (DUF416 family)
MRYDEFAIDFRDNVYSLSFEKQIELGLHICKRLFPDYVAFHVAHNWGNYDLLLDSINLADKAMAEEFDKAAIESLIAKIETVIPDIDDFGDELSGYALNASAAVGELLQFLIDRDPEHIYNIGTYLTDNIDIKIQEKETIEPDAVEMHPQLIEVRKQLIQLSKNGA